MNAETEQIELSDPTWMFNKKRNLLEEKWFYRRYSLALITSFPFDYLYLRAATAAFSNGEASPWIAFISTLVLSAFIALFVLFLGSLFSAALSFEPDKVT